QFDAEEFSELKSQYPWPSLWLRGLPPLSEVRWLRGLPPLSEVRHPKPASEQCGLQVTGLWSTQSTLEGSRYVFACDASGGPGGSDQRLLVTTWSIGAYALVDGQPKRVASATCLEAEPLTVPQAEQRALFELMHRVTGDFDATTDCKSVKQILCKANPPQEGVVPWGTIWHERSRIRLHWVSSHKSAAYFEKQGWEQWRRLINEDVDKLCGERASQHFSIAHAKWLKKCDSVVEQVCYSLARRAGFIIRQRKSPDFPWILNRGATDTAPKPLVVPNAAFVKPSPAKPKNAKNPKSKKGVSGDKPGPGPKTGKPLNKKQRMLEKLAMPEDPLGHQWVKGAEGPTNLTMKCTKCGLYVQQIADPASFDRLMTHHCIGGGEILSEWGIHATHSMVNMGVQWSCSKCGRLQRPQSAVGAKQLQKPCDGRAAVSQIGKVAQGVGSSTLDQSGPAGWCAAFAPYEAALAL
ncbi:unnamed protein product, partial [Symbiodinium sp. CCMP2592]